MQAQGGASERFSLFGPCVFDAAGKVVREARRERKILASDA